MIKNVRRGDNSPMMIIAQNPRRAKDKIFFFTRPHPVGSSLFTAPAHVAQGSEPEHKVWDGGRHNSSIYAIFYKGNQKFSPTSTWFSTGKVGKTPSFPPIKNRLTEKPSEKFVTFHRGRLFACAASAWGRKRKTAQNIAQIDGVKFYAFDGECVGNGVEFLQLSS